MTCNFVICEGNAMSSKIYINPFNSVLYNMGNICRGESIHRGLTLRIVVETVIYEDNQKDIY